MKYTEEHIAFLTEHITGCPFATLAEKFNRHFGLNLSASTVRSFAGKHGLYSGLRSRSAVRCKNDSLATTLSPRIYTQEHVKFLAENVKGCHFCDLTNKFNQHFGINASMYAVIGLARQHGLRNGLDTRLNGGHGATRLPWNYKPVGSERVDSNGYTYVKEAATRKWRPKHIVIWEAAHGPPSPGRAVIFADRNKRNFAIDNLVSITWEQLVRMNGYRLFQNDPELTRAGITVTNVISKCAEREKQEKRRCESKAIKEEKVNEK